jgi:hypothetical protein
VKKITKEEGKNPLTWWGAHEVQFWYVGFVAQKIPRIVVAQIEAKMVFNIISIYMNLWHSWLGIENLDLLKSIYKKWLNDVRVSDLGFMKQFMDWKKLNGKNEDVINKSGLLSWRKLAIGSR